MAKKSAITEKYTLSASGILDITNGVVSLENVETGELIPFSNLLHGFKDCSITLSVSHGCDYDDENK